MEVLTGANNFTIGNLYASDGNGGKDVVAMALLEKLANAACLGAGHQSDERYDAPKCHPETRAAVIKDIMSWVNTKDSNEPIMWMSGPAGAGKSAIAQTVCDKLDEDQKLLASFFFSRTATGSGRSEGKRLVPTIACLMAIVIPEIRPIIIERLKSDSAMLTYSIEKQLHQLVLEPLAEIYKKTEQDKLSIDSHTPYVVVIDGLDECNDPKEQSRIVRMISGIFVGLEEPIQLRFLITSRPELEIRNSFESVIDSGMCANIVLNEAYNPDEDIWTYLRSEFVALKREHTLRKSLQQEPGWPSFEAIEDLVKKSSGQFIYASTVIKCLRNPRRDPRQGLCGILDSNIFQINTTQDESPYIALDSLYKHILISSLTSYELYKFVFQIILFSLRGYMLAANRPRTLEDLSEFTGLTQFELELRLSDLHSLIYIPDNDDFIKFYHASFGDFLTDETRSQNFYISEIKAHKYIAQRCLSIILEISPETDWYRLHPSQQYSVDRFFVHLKHSDFDEELLTMLRSETTLHAVLEVLSNLKRYDYLNLVIIFSFNDCESATQSYWTPKIEKIKDICLEIVKFVEERFLTKMHSIGTLNGDDVVKALLRTAFARRNAFSRDKFYFKWLEFLLKNSIHGNHLYLDSEKSFLVYKKLVQDTDENTRRHYGYGNDAYYPALLKYLLQKIQPSADVDIDLFSRASEQVLNEITEYRSKARDIEDLQRAVEKFLEQCSVLKQQTRRDFRMRFITTIKDASSKLKGKLR